MNLFPKAAAILLCFLFSSVTGLTQQLNWAHSIGGPLVESSNTVRTDNAGNVYIAGKFSGANVDFDPSPATFLLSSAGSSDAFVAKYSSTGQFLWAFRYGGTDRDEIDALTIDQNNNIYITGFFRGAGIDFDPGAGVAPLTSNGDAGGDPGYGGDIVVAKYDANGQYQWAFNVGGSELYDSGIAIQTDAAGDVYVGGYFKHDVDFDPSAASTIINSNNGTIFLAKYTSAGAFQWAFPLGLANDNNSVFDLKTDAAGNVYATGYFQGTNIDFDPSPASALLSSNGAYEVFVAKYNTNGQYQFAFSLGGTGLDVGRGIELDNSGNIYVLGDFDSPSVDFNPGAGTNILTTNGSSDVFVAKYSPTGQYLWAFNFGGTPAEYGWKITTDNSHLFVTGAFSGTADLDPSPAVENITSAGGLDIFVGKYTLNGEYLCSFKIGSPGNDIGASIFSSAPNVFYLTGVFTGTNIDFDPAATTFNLSSAGSDDNFLVKYTWPDNVLPSGTLVGGTICVGEQAQFTFNATTGTGPYTLVINNGVTNVTYTNVQSGVPFNVAPNPTSTTIYTLVSVKDALRCSETNFVSGSATITVNDCNGNFCDSWLRLPSNPSYVTVGDLDVTGNKLTVEALVNRIPPLNNGLHYGHLVSKHTDQSNVNYALQLLGCELTTDVTGYVALAPTCQPVTNKTYHVAMVYDGTTLKYYRNGFLMAQTPVTGNMINNNLFTKIGEVAGPTNPLNNQTLGYTNEVRVWNVARTQAEIRAAMNGPLANPTTQTGLLAYYSFNNLYNKQGNPAFNGTLQGAAVINQTNPLCGLTTDSCELITEKIINDYTEVLGLDVCKNTLTVTNAAAFNVGDTVLIAQMRGAVINTTNTIIFGAVTDYRGAGNYEFNYVKSKTGNTIELKNVLTRQYNIPDGKVQLIRVPYYQDFVTSANSVLTCLPWDGNKGGILVFNVANTLQLGGNIDVSGKGFKGAAGNNTGLLVTNCFTNDFFYPNTSTIAAAKGEGIALLDNTNNRGKGPAANAGGGGLDHNSGGGGGGNSGTGGFGGYQLETCGNAPFNNRGIGGIPMLYNNAGNKIFMGGAGGAGHANNPANSSYPSSGGNGGGIVIISAQSLQNSAYKIMSNGGNAPGCPFGLTGDCHDGMGGGGAAGTVLLNIPTVTSNTTIEIKGGNGADVSGPVTAGRIGPGGGGSGGIFWSSTPSLPANINVNVTGGARGVLLQDGNNPWGASAGSLGGTVYNLQLPIDNLPFKANIDSVRIKDSLTGCKSFDFKGFGYTNTYPVASWQWYFGDGGTNASQNTSHTYNNEGTYTVKLIITDVNGCKDSITREVTATSLSLDFTYHIDACSPLTVQFNAVGTTTQNPYWSFGDVTAPVTGTLNTVHAYASQNNFTVQFSAGNGVCTDTITKTISLFIIPADIIFTPDTTICSGSLKQLRAQTALSHCWSPVTYLNNPALSNPVTSTPGPITYYYTAEVTGANLIVNGNFSQGNTGITSQYVFTNPNTAEGQYFVGANPQAWNVNLTACGDHTTGTSNMMLVNGSATDNVKVWSQTVTVIPNTNYAFSAWLQDVAGQNPATLQFSINGVNMGAVLQAGSPCNWQQFYTTWNSGTTTSAIISIVNKNLILSGNDFALDDISFAPVFIQRDSVKITVDTPFVKTSDDAAICEGKNIQLSTTGAISYSWTQAATLSNAGIGNPLAAPLTSTQYIVTGTNANGCIAKDTVNITVNAKPAITKSPNREICKNASVQIFATGGGTYTWTPAATLDNPALPNPTASPLVNTRYYVTVTGANTCTNIDSVDISIRPDPVFTVGAGGSICIEDSIQLTAAGGTIYSWQPAASLSNGAIANPRAAPATTTNYSVTITETTCNISTVLQTNVTVNSLPVVKATKANDLDCSNDQSQLNATGAVSYTWIPALSLNNPNIANPVATPTGSTKYIVKGTDAQGCSNYDSLTVEYLAVNTAGYFMPNAFTPNHDGLNDCYGIRYWGVIRELEFSIYNRWGERIFFTKDPGACWDGSYKGKMQDIGVYVYMISAKTLCGDTFKKGLFTLAK